MQYIGQMPASEVVQESPSQILSRPNAVFLAEVLESRLRSDNGDSVAMPLPEGVNRDLRPGLPNAGKLALSMYLNRKTVDSYPLMYTTIALAHPN